jgi:quinol monooxygenase YgiN
MRPNPLLTESGYQADTVGTTHQEDTMSTPFIFIGTHRIKAGKRDDFLRYFSDFCDNVVEPQEPRLHSFYGYTTPDSDVVTVVQVHPDAESMLTHMAVGIEHFGKAYAEYLEPDSKIQVYGQPNAEVLHAITAAAQVDDDVSPLVIREPYVGFDRLEQR